MTYDNHARTHARSNGDHNGTPTLDCSRSVNAILTTFPATLPVFNRFGLDTCCGSALSVADAARAADVDSEALCEALSEALRGTARSGTPSRSRTGEL
jgi:iron-sulfur cluster repair protein YtfE (RIC family)